MFTDTINRANEVATSLEAAFKAFSDKNALQARILMNVALLDAQAVLNEVKELKRRIDFSTAGM